MWRKACWLHRCRKAKRSDSTFKVRRNDLVQGKEQRLRFAGGQKHWNYNHRKLANLITWTTALSNSMKLSHALWGQPRLTGHVERSGRVWSTGEGNGKPFQYSCLENPRNSTKRKNHRKLKEELPRLVGAQHATGDQWRNTPEKMKGWSQSKNNTQLWMWLVIEARSDAVKSNIA